MRGEPRRYAPFTPQHFLPSMPAQEQTFYSLKRLHAVFAITSLALAAATVWLVVIDHCREWKAYQRTFRDRVEPWLTEAELRDKQIGDSAVQEEQLVAALDKARREVPPPQQIAGLVKAVQDEGPWQTASAIQDAYQALAAKPSADRRQRLLECIEEAFRAATFGREESERRLRFRRADFDEARTTYEAAVGQSRPQAELDALASRVAQIKREVEQLAAAADEAAARSDALAALAAAVTADERQARKALADHRAATDALRRALYAQQPSFGKQLLRLPLLEVFGRPLAIQQMWLPELTINYHFCQVARFDRCTTCHLAIDKTLSGSPTLPACLAEQTLLIRLATPKQAPKPTGAKASVSAEALVESLYGLALAQEGILDAQAPTVGLVVPKTAAARAEMAAGDVILAIDGSPVADRADAIARLASPKAWGKSLVLEVRRGLPLPFRSHPRLDLFVGSLSPHPASTFGCTICHGGQGSATAFRFASHTPNDPQQAAQWRKEHGWFWNPDWDPPMRPARFLQSGCLRCHHDVVDLEPTRRYPDPPAPKLLAGYHLVRQHGCFGCHEINGAGPSGERLGPDLRSQPRVGPSLRDLAGKLDRTFVRDWIEQPSRFRPRTRMPRLFGMYEHLAGPSLAHTRRLEAVELSALTEYLLAVSRPIVPLGTPSGVSESPSAQRGKRLFALHGCLACHRHQDFPQSKATQGPDLTNLGSKLGTPAGAKWLARWLRDPAHHAPQTLMPNALLEPIGKTDPVADLAAYLMSSRAWQPKKFPPVVEADLDALALEHLTRTYPTKVAQQYLKQGIPASMASQVLGDAVELVGPMTLQKKLHYVGRRTIRKRGCFGCHDIPGFEDAAPIGPALSDWGRKQESLLAFEQVHKFVAERPSPRERGSAEAFFTDALLAQRREGFLWQKLRAPRSFDYQKAQNKGFNEQLLMGKFTLTDDEREAIMTFVLGLVAEPPSTKYLYQPDARRKAIVEGRKVLDKYGCALCHVLEMDRWTFTFDPEKFAGPSSTEDFAFLAPPITPEALEASKQADRRGLGRAEVVGMPRVDAEGKPLIAEGDEEDERGEALPLLSFTLWEPAAINGQVWRVGGADVMLYPYQITGKRPPWGGDFARLVYPIALADAKASGSTASEVEAWGWVPPPLIDEGLKVEPAWLYEYLLDPYVIRPASVLRMPKYNLSPEEAGKLVDFFAASSGAEFPYSSDPRSRPARLDALRQQQSDRLQRALRLVIDRTTYCAKCHLIGDFSPGGEIQTVLAPNLDRVGRRLKPEYLRRWLANPKSILPYTAMPVNFPPTGQPLGQDLYPGTSLEQLDAVMDLLLGYDVYLKGRSSIRAMVGQQAGAKPSDAPEASQPHTTKKD